MKINLLILLFIWTANARAQSSDWLSGNENIQFSNATQMTNAFPTLKTSLADFRATGRLEFNPDSPCFIKETDEGDVMTLKVRTGLNDEDCKKSKLTSTFTFKKDSAGRIISYDSGVRVVNFAFENGRQIMTQSVMREKIQYDRGICQKIYPILKSLDTACSQKINDLVLTLQQETSRDPLKVFIPEIERFKTKMVLNVNPVMAAFVFCAYHDGSEVADASGVNGVPPKAEKAKP